MAWVPIATAAIGAIGGAMRGTPSASNMFTDSRSPFTGQVDHSGWNVSTGNSVMTNPRAQGGSQSARTELGGMSAPGAAGGYAPGSVSPGAGVSGAIGGALDGEIAGIPGVYWAVGALALVLVLKRRKGKK